MKVFIVIEYGVYIENGLLCNTLGVHTTMENAKTEMINCHQSFINNSIKNLCDYDNDDTIISSEVDEMECSVIYQTFGEVEKHFVIIEERIIEHN